MTDAQTPAHDPPRPLRRSRAATLALALCGLYGAWLAVDLFRHAPEAQRDFAIYYYAAAAHRTGRDPYALETIKRLSGGRAILPFIYPAATLYAFRPFTSLEYGRAARLYLGLKLLALAGLLLIWRNVFLDRRGGLFFYLFCLVGFNAAIYIDLMSGNLALFEQFVLWAALACLLAGRDVLFAVLIAAAAAFKITPVLFLVLPLLLRGRRGWAPALLGAGLFGALLAASSAVPFGQGFWAAIRAKPTEEFGVYAPSTYAFVRACRGLVAALVNAKPGAGEALDPYLYALAVAAILFVSWRAWLNQVQVSRLQAHPNSDARLLILFFCLVYMLVLPRFKDYSCILLLAPTLYIVRCWDGGRGLPLLALILLAYPANTVFRLPVLGVLFPFLLNYHPWLIAAGVWGLFVSLMLRKSQAPADPNLHAI